MHTYTDLSPTSKAHARNPTLTSSSGTMDSREGELYVYTRQLSFCTGFGGSFSNGLLYNFRPLGIISTVVCYRNMEIVNVYIWRTYVANLDFITAFKNTINLLTVRKQVCTFSIAYHGYICQMKLIFHTNTLHRALC